MLGFNLGTLVDAGLSLASGQAANRANVEIAKQANQHAYKMWQEEMAFNSAEAAKQRDWEEQMSNTAYQRARQDMEAAGINPILLGSSAQAASTGTGYAASTSGAPSVARPTIINVGQNGINTAQKSASIDNKTISSLFGALFG